MRLEMNVDDKNKERLYKKGLKCFIDHSFYDAHEYWEDLWLEYRLPDAKFIQGLIQLSVGCYHISNLNINGARGLLNKCKPKLSEYAPIYRDININDILKAVDNSLEYLDKNNNLQEFDWDLVPKLK